MCGTGAVALGRRQRLLLESSPVVLCARGRVLWSAGLASYRRRLASIDGGWRTAAADMSAGGGLATAVVSRWRWE